MRLRSLLLVANAAVLLAGLVTVARHDTSTIALRAAEPPAAPAPAATGEPAPTTAPTTSPPTATTSAPVATAPGEHTHPTGSAVPTAWPTTTETPDEPTLVLNVSRDHLPTATKVQLTARWRVATDVFVRVHLDDGRPPFEGGGWCGAHLYQAKQVGDWYEATFDWSFRKAGTYHVWAETLHYPCAGGSMDQVARTAVQQVVVTQGADVGNGPWAPWVTVGFQDSTQANFTEPDPYKYMLYAITADPDGWLRGVRIDWHDGTAPEESELPLADCTSSGYPDTSFPWGGQGGTPSIRTMPGPGTYHVTVTAWSTTCTGDEVQTTTVTATLVVP